MANLQIYHPCNNITSLINYKPLIRLRVISDYVVSRCINLRQVTLVVPVYNIISVIIGILSLGITTSIKSLLSLLRSLTNRLNTYRSFFGMLKGKLSSIVIGILILLSLLKRLTNRPNTYYDFFSILKGKPNSIILLLRYNYS